jgi:tetratricopeptide (TPR) repeat protein
MRLARLALGLLLVASSDLAAGADPAVKPAAARPLVEDGTPYEEARAILEKAIAGDPTNAGAHYLLARVDYALRDFEKATALLEKAVALEPKRADYRVLLGRSALARIDNVSIFKKASLARTGKEAFQTAVTLEPGNIPAHMALLQFYQNAPGIAGGDKDLAAAQAEAIAKLDPVQGHLARVALLPSDRAPEEIEKDLKAALALDPNRAQTQYQLGIFYAGHGKQPEAEALFQKCLEADATRMAASYQMGKLYLTGGVKLDKAEASFKTYLTRWPEEGMPSWAHAHWRLGQVYQKQGKESQAVIEWQQALKLNPDLKEAKESLAGSKK